MRIFEFLQNLNAKSLRLTSKRKSGMVVFVLSAPTAQQLKYAREHLRYWPYVKAFRPVDDTNMEVLVFVGREIPEIKWNYYVIRSCELMNLSVRQYHALFIISNNNNEYSFRKYHRNGFHRPDNLLKPFSDFIDEMNHYGNYRHNYK